MNDAVVNSYSSRSAEYVEALGSMHAMDPLDVSLIAGWGRGVAGLILDAGCGPGHWTELLRTVGCDVRGVDLVQEFVDSARTRFPGAEFDVDDFLDPRFESGDIRGVLAWYSLIHLHPNMREKAFSRLASLLQPGGSILIGGFWGEDGVPFDHAITTAFYWSAERLEALLLGAGFEVVELRTRPANKSRAHVNAIARLVAS